jgi:acetolactate synthase I/III small subunit
MLHTLTVYVEDKPGVLNRVASLFRRRAFNIDSLTVGHTEQPGVSRMTIVCDVDEMSIRRVEANVYKLVNVLRVDDLTHIPAVERELAMIKVSTTHENRSEVLQLAGVFRARVIDVSSDSVIVETTGTNEKIDRLLDVLLPYGVIEVARTGVVAMARGTRPLRRRRRRGGPARRRGSLVLRLKTCTCGMRNAECGIRN